MWCPNCGQDVPRVPSPDSGELRCLRCGRPSSPCAPGCGASQAGHVQAVVGGEVDQVVALADGLSTVPYDGWEMEEQLRHIGRRRGAAPATEEPAPSAVAGSPEGRALRIDAAHAVTRGRHGPAEAQRARRGPATTLDLAAWLVALLGLAALSCGGVLVGWSLVTGRVELWTVGWPLATGGLVVVALAAAAVVVLRLDRLRREARRTETRLAEFGSRLHRLQTAAELMNTAHHSPSGAFYGHLADGATPKILLADLKSQLDLLAVKIADQE